MSKLVYAPFVAPFTVIVRHAPGFARNSLGWDCYYFWNPFKAVDFAKNMVSGELNIHASIYFKWRYAMRSKTLCRVIKKDGVVRVVREFSDPNYPEQIV